MLEYSDIILITIAKKEIEKEEIENDFFQEKVLYAIDIRNLENNEVITVYQKLIKL